MPLSAGEVQMTLTLKSQMAEQMAKQAQSSGQSLAQIQMAIKQAQEAVKDYEKELERWGGAQKVVDAMLPSYEAAKQKVVDLEAAMKSLSATAKDMPDLLAGMKQGGLGLDPLAAMKSGLLDLEHQIGPTRAGLAGLSEMFSGFGGDFAHHVLSFTAGLSAFHIITGIVHEAWRGLTELVSSSVEGWGRQEMATMRMVAAMKAQGTAAPQIVAQYTALSAAYEKNTMFADEQINTVQALLVQIGDVMPKDMDRALKATTDLSAGLGIDLEAAARLVGKAFMGHTETLGRYGIVVNQAKVQAEGFGVVLDAIQDHFGGQAQAQAETYSGRVQQLSNAWDNVEEAIGKIIVQNPIFEAGLRAVQKAVEDGQKSVDGQATSLAALSIKYGGASAEVASYIYYLEVLIERSNTAAKGFDMLSKMPVPPSIMPSGPPAIDWRAEMSDADKYKNVVADVSVTLDRLSAAQKNAALAAFSHGLSVADTLQELREYWPTIDRSKIALEALHQSYEDGKSKGKAYAAAVQNITDLLAENGVEWDWSAEQALKFGAGVSEVATALGRSKGDIQSVQKEMKDYAASVKLMGEIHEKTLVLAGEHERAWVAEDQRNLKQVNKQWMDNFTDLGAAQRAYNNEVEQRTLSSYDYQKYLIYQHLADEKVALEKKGGNWKAAFELDTKVANDAIDAIEWKEIQDNIDETDKAMEDWQKHSDDVMKGLADSFAQMAQVAGGALGGVVGAIGQVIVGLQQMKRAQESVRTGMADWSAGNKMAGAQGIIGGLATQYGSAISSGANAETGGTDEKGNPTTFNETMLSGMNLKSGSTYAAAIGTFGISLGVQAGIAAIKYLFRDRTMEDVARDAGEQFGTKFSKATMDAIGKSVKEGSRIVTAEMLNLGAIIKDAGGLDSGNIDRYSQKFRDVFAMLAQGWMTVGQATKIIDDNWETFVQAGTDGAGRINVKLKEMIDLNTQFGTKSKEIAQWEQQQAGTAAAGFNAVAIALKGDRDSLVAVGAQAMIAFAAMVATGKSEAEALASIGPGLDALIQSYADLGLTIDDVGLSALAMQEQINKGNPQLIQGVAGLTAEMVALDNLGLMNTETFGKMEKSGYAMYVRLQAAAAAVGGTTKDALVPMQGWLHEAAKEAELLGIPLDANTQMLIEQSKELGIWKDQGKSAAEQTTDAMLKLVDAVQQLIDHLNGIPTHINTDVTVTHHDDQVPNADVPDVPVFGPEVFVPHPMVARVGTNGGEYVLHKDTVDRMMQGGNRRSNDGDIVQELRLLRALIPTAMRDAVHRS